MITKIGELDNFGYDDYGQPCVVQLKPHVIVAGYTFCAHLKEALTVKFEVVPFLFGDGGAIIAIFSPRAKKAELWFSRWSKDKHSIFHIVNPSYTGLTEENFDDMASFIKRANSGVPLGLIPGYLKTAETVPNIHRPDLIPELKLRSRLEKPTRRFPNLRVDETQFSENEKIYADDLKHALHNLFSYVYRIRAASELNMHAESMHFMVPAVVPPSEHRFQLLLEWKCIAARDAAFSIFHFQRTFEYLRNDLPQNCPNLRSKVVLGELRIAWKLYNSWFKDTIKTRNAIGHSAEFYITSEGRLRHSNRTDMFIEFMMINDTMSVPSAGSLVSVEVSMKTVDRLERVRALILEAYSAVLKPI